MLLVIVIVLLLIGSAVVGSIYSGFLVFYNNFSEVENYNKAYYAAVGALERAELVVKQRGAGFEGSGGWIEGVGTGMLANGGSDGPIDSFSYLSSTDSQKSSLFWTITSRTSRIPKEGEGDVDWTLLSGDADYNVMGYEYAENFLLYYDNGGGGSPYSSNFLYTKSPVSSITGVIRLPEKLKSDFGNLNETFTYGRVKNDAIVDWQLRGNYGTKPFTIYATQRTAQKGSEYKIASGDSSIRESDVNKNGGARLLFSKNKTPLTTRSTTDAQFTIISPAEVDIKNYTPQGFQSIFNGGIFTDLKLRLALLNLLQTEKSMIYPYLEYYMEFSHLVSDKYFTINAEGKYGDYQVNLVVKKPTFKESILGSFTVVF